MYRQPKQEVPPKAEAREPEELLLEIRNLISPKER